MNITHTKNKHTIHLPDYTRAEEIFNMVSHIVGVPLAIVMIVLNAVFGAIAQNPYAVVSGVIYGATILIMFSVSAIYHGLLPCIGKRVMRVIDHCDIYLAIAGTYMPILLVGIRPLDPVLAWTIFGIQWGVAAISITFTAINFKKFAKIGFIGYIVMGWCIICCLFPTIQAMTPAGFAWLLAGGIAFTIGAILYVVGKKKRFIHSVFHIFVVIGVALQWVAIFFFLYV